MSIEAKLIENIFSPGFVLYNELLFDELLSNFNLSISLFCKLIKFFNLNISSFLSFNSFSKFLILSSKYLFLFFSSFNFFSNSIYLLSEFKLLSFFNIWLGMKSINVFEEKYNNKKYKINYI